MMPIADADAMSGGGPEAAVATIQDYYARIDRHAFDAAYVLWDGGGQASGQSLEDFTRGFAHTAHTQVVTGSPGAPEGAAGSSFVTVPVSVAATLDDGRQQRFTGHYVLHRVNDVPGSSPDERHWRLHSADLQPA